MKATKNFKLIDHLENLEQFYMTEMPSNDPYRKRLLKDLRQKMEQIRNNNANK